MRRLVLLAALLVPAFAHAQERKLNLLVIVTDDQAPWTIGAYGSKEARTPHQDRLAREGVLFKNAFVPTPVCSPSRASFLTGRYGTQVGITDWVTPQESKKGMGLPVDVVTWMQVLRRAGYATGLIGKWHLGETAEHHPNARGYDTFVGFLTGGNTPMNPTLEIDLKTEKLKGSLPDILVDHAIEFVTKNKAGPFALQLNFREPHAPYAPTPADDAEPFKNIDIAVPKVAGLDAKKVQQLRREYYASVHSIDRNLGRLLESLEKLGILENTIIVFTSDHGYMIGQHGLWHKGNATWMVGPNVGVQRANMYDLVLQVPLIVRVPGGRRGAVCEDIVDGIDMFPTLLGLVGAAPPTDYKHHGRDFSPAIRSATPPATYVPRDAHFAQYDVHNGLGKTATKSSMRSVLTKDWHLIRQYEKNHPDELFDRVNDPDEFVNLYGSAKHREIRDGLQARLDAWMRSIDDPRAPKK